MRDDDSVFSSLQQVTGATYTNASYNRDLLGIYLLRKAREKGIRLPTGGPPDEFKYLGAKVFTSHGGMSHNVTYIDVGSMYPSQLLSMNASPETIIGTEDELADSQYTVDDCVWGYIDPRPVKHLSKGEPWRQYTDGTYKMIYDPHAPAVKWTCDERNGPQYEKLYFLDHDTQKGFLTECVEELIDLKNQYRGTSLYGSTKRVTNCYSSDTMVVASDGIKNIQELEVGEEVYSIDPDTNTVELKVVTKTFEYPDYSDELLHFQCQGVDLAVTPNHKMVVRGQYQEYRDDESYEFIKASKIDNKSAQWLPHDWSYSHGNGIDRICLADYVDDVSVHVAPANGGTSFRYHIDAEMDYEGSHRQTYEMEYSEFQRYEDEIREHATSLSVASDEYARVPLEYSGDNMAKFVGWYVAEGSITYHNSGSCEIRLTQMDDDGRETICSLLDEMGFDYSVRGEKTVRFSSAVFAKFLEEQCGNGSENKKLPTFVDEFDGHQKQLMFEAMMAGDGHWATEDSGRYTTKSMDLRNDVICLMVELGHAPNYKKENGSWTVTFSSRNPTLRCSDWEETTAEDGVYCVEVADNHTLMAGRNGKFQFSGNSIYGVLGFANKDSSFRLFDWRIAEAITLCGRKMIEHSANYVLNYLEEEGYDDSYVALGDTDGCGISVPTAATRHEALDVVEDAVEQLNDEGYDEFFTAEMGVDPQHHHGVIEVESYAPRVFIPSRNPPHGEVGVKKRRIEWQCWDEDDGEIDDISITGLEAERSDVAPITKEAQRLFAETLRMDQTDAREWLFPKLRELHEEIASGAIALDRICKRGGLGQSLDEYGSANRRAGPLYRGARYANDHLDGVTIQRGDKPAVVYLSDVPDEYPSTYDTHTAEDGDRVDAVSLLDPTRLPEGFVVDYAKHRRKALIEPMEPLLETRFGAEAWGQIQHQHEQQGLTAFE